MPLDPCQLEELLAIRDLSRSQSADLMLWTGSAIVSTDAYRRIPGIQSGTFLKSFSGAMAWNPEIGIADSAGGKYIHTSNLRISVSRDLKPDLSRKDIYIIVDGIELELFQITDLPDTNELLLETRRRK